MTDTLVCAPWFVAFGLVVPVPLLRVALFPSALSPGWWGGRTIPGHVSDLVHDCFLDHDSTRDYGGTESLGECQRDPRVLAGVSPAV